MRREGQITHWMCDRMNAQWGVALARIVYGGFVVLTVLLNWGDRQWFWGSGSQWAQPYRDRSAWPAVPFGVFDGSSRALTPLLLVLVVAALAMTVGLCCRAATVVVLVMSTSLVAAGPTTTDTEDIVLRIMLVWLCLADTSQRWSVDRWIARRRGRLVDVPGDRPRRRGLLPDWVRVPLHNAAVTLIMGQLIIIYLMAGVAKLRGATWQNGTAIYYPLHAAYISPWPGLGRLVAGQGALIHLLTWGSVVLQITFGLLLLHRRTRLVAVLSMVCLHLGIAVELGLGMFSLAMVGADAVFIRDASVERMVHLVKRRGRRPARAEQDGLGGRPAPAAYRAPLPVRASKSAVR